MIITHLNDDLISHLKSAKEAYIAVALMKEYGLAVIENNIQNNCSLKLLIGVDLPTTPSVLKRALILNQSAVPINCKISPARPVFHPKMYLMRLENNNWVAFLGSANATQGGLNTNTELTVQIESPNQCSALLRWFDDLYTKSRNLTAQYVAEYEAVYKKNLSLRNTQKSNLDKLQNIPAAQFSDTLFVNSTQFFSQEDFEAFRLDKHFDNSDLATKRRSSVRDKFLELDTMLFPRFNDYGIFDLHHTDTPLNYTSQWFHSRGALSRKDALWLHYGKSAEQRAGDRFTNHSRIQVILRNNEEAFVGIWLFVGKPNFSIADRQNLRERLNADSYTEALFEQFSLLGESYYIHIEDNSFPLSDIVDATHLRTILRRERNGVYFFIGRDYDPNAEELSVDNIGEHILAEFSKLYKIYKMIT
jgi:HKD family nuclease